MLENTSSRLLHSGRRGAPVWPGCRQEIHADIRLLGCACDLLYLVDASACNTAHIRTCQDGFAHTTCSDPVDAAPRTQPPQAHSKTLACKQSAPDPPSRLAQYHLEQAKGSLAISTMR